MSHPRERAPLPPAGGTPGLARLMHRVSAGLLGVERVLGPLLDVGIRVWLAKAFLVSGLLKVADFDRALTLARYEYPVPWMDPVTAAYLGAAIEITAPLLLVLGLASRFAAAALLALTLVIQTHYVALDIHLLWAALALWYVVGGAGSLSLDRMLAKGLADSAIPLAATAIRAGAWMRHIIRPGYSLLVRLWLAAACAAVWLAASANGAHAPIALPALDLWLPVTTLAPLALGAGPVLVVLLLAGVATRVTALSLLGLVLGAGMLDLARTEYTTGLSLILTLFAVHGAGPIALDAIIGRWIAHYLASTSLPHEARPRVVIVGAGFGGLACAQTLTRAPVSVTVVDRQNYHLFQPLLYQVATAGLAPGDIATPTRSLFRDEPNVRVLLGEVTGVDTAHQAVLIGPNRLPYDYLVLATGAAHSYFGRDDWAPFAPGLKRIEDALAVRSRLLLAFERAEAEDDPDERQSLLTFLIVGGGPTGVELAGAIAELARFGMEKEFRRFDPATTRVILVQSAPRLLPTFPERLSAIAEVSLRRLEVEVITGSQVEHIDDAGVLVNGERIAARTVLWAAGVIASPAARWLKAGADRAGRLKVGPDLSVPGLPNVFAVGDTVLAHAWAGQAVPGLAPAAKQGGRYVARVIAAPGARQAIAGAVSLPASWQPGHHRPQGRGRQLRLPAIERGARLVVVGIRSRILFGGGAQSYLGDLGLGLGLSHLPRRHSAHYQP